MDSQDGEGRQKNFTGTKKDDDYVQYLVEKPEGRSLVLLVVTSLKIVKVGNKGGLVDTEAQDVTV